MRGTSLSLSPYEQDTLLEGVSEDVSNSPQDSSSISPALEPALLWALLWKYGGLVLSTDTVLVQSLETYYSFLWFDPALSEVSPNFFRLQVPRTIPLHVRSH